MRDTTRIGRYEILKHLASGGMGSVYLARSTGPAGFEHHVVLKMLDVEASEDAPIVAMFLDEARVVGRMHHQHIAPAYALDCDDHGRYFLVMDYVHGQTAKATWRRSREFGVPLPLTFTLAITTAGAAALHYAHTLTSSDGESLGVVHRDVSLSNLMIGYDGAIKLIDFGIAKAANRAVGTQAGQIKGKVAYMAPEQLRGDATDPRADIFGLGVVLYELATMRRAFRASTDLETSKRIMQGQFVRPSTIDVGFPRELEAIIMTALQVDPAARFQDANMMRRDLEAFGRRRRLVVGDSAVVAVMEVLFEDRSEPWQAKRRAESELAPPIEVLLFDNAVAAPMPAVVAEIHDAPTARLADHADDVLTQPVVIASSETPSEAEAKPRQPTLSSWARWLVPFAILGSGIALFDGFWVHGLTEAVVPPATPPPDSPTRPIQTTPSPNPVSPTPHPTSVQVHVKTTPPDATVLLDGQWLGHTPFDGSVSATPGPHTLKIRRRGFVPQKIEVDLSKDIVRAVTLRTATLHEAEPEQL